MEPEKFKTHRAKRKWTTLVIRRKTILSQFLPTSEEGSLHFWRASRLSLPLALSRISAVKFRWHYKPCEFFTLNFTDSLLHFSYWDFFTCPHCSLFGQSTMVSSGCQARWPGLLFIPSSCNFCHWWTSLPHHSSVITSPASFILWLELPLSQWPVWFFPIWCLYSAFPRQKLENNSQNYLNK